MIDPATPASIALALLAGAIIARRRFPWFAAALAAGFVVFARPWVAAHLPGISPAWEIAADLGRPAVFVLALRFLWVCALAFIAWPWPIAAAPALGFVAGALPLAAWGLAYHPRAPEFASELATMCYPALVALALAAIGWRVVGSPAKETSC